MIARIKKHQRRCLVVLIVICMAIVLLGGVQYIDLLRTDLAEQSIQNVLTVTYQQKQAFDNFTANDWERVHSMAGYFATLEVSDTSAIQKQLALLGQVDAYYTVLNLENGRYCSNKSDKIYQLSDEQLEEYRALSGSGVRGPYVNLYTDDIMFGYYERFMFRDGTQGMVQKGYNCNKLSKEFSLSFYNDQGLAYIVNREGDILLRSVGMMGDHLYTNIFDILTGTHGTQESIDTFMEALHTQDVGSMTFSGSMGEYVYSYVSLESAEDWYLVSVVPRNAIMEETDHILMHSWLTFGYLAVVLLACAIFILLIWHTFRDIKRKEQTIEYQAQRFDIFATYLSRNTNDVYMMLDAEEIKVEYVSPNVERVLGISIEDILDDIRHFTPTYLSEDPPDLNALIRMAPGQEAEIVKVQWIDPKTKEQKCFVENLYCTQVQGRTKLVVYISDRTQERKTQDALSEALRMAQAANNAKSAFLGNVSHDIRTPMNAIIGFLELMRNEKDDPAMVMEYTQRIDAASQHLLGLINDVLDINKIESGSATLNIAEMDLAEVIEEINTIIRPQTKAKGQEFDISVTSLRYEHLLGDKLRIDQILINLLSNAVKYTPNGGTIQLRVEELPQAVDDYSYIRFTVKDDGMGMSEDYLKVIFDPFTREEAAVAKQIQGTGLGMAITKSLVDLMGGTIKVDSELGKGSTFTVEMELRIQERKDEPEFWEDHGLSRMIVADDDEEICQHIVKTMSKTEVRVDHATSGEAAVRMVRQAREEGRPYDLILLDWKMPGLSGLDTARLIRKDRPDKVPIFLLTAYDWSDIEQEAMEIGVDHFLPKPFFLSTFKEGVRRVMDSRKTGEESQTDVVQGKHILVVDDIEVNRIILVKILTTMGAQCDIACNGQEALETFMASQPGGYDLILMDVQMPVLDGYAATRAIRGSGHPSAREVPIIAMTANAFVDDVRDAINAGMDAHIAKPVQLDKLRSTIQQVMDGRKDNDIIKKEIIP